MRSVDSFEGFPFPVTFGDTLSDEISSQAKAIVTSMVQLEADKRPTAEELLDEDFFQVFGELAFPCRSSS